MNAGIRFSLVGFNKINKKESGILERTSIVEPFISVIPIITWACFASMPIPIAASIPWSADEGKNSLKAPKRKRPNKNIKIPEKTTAANVNKYPWYRFPSPKEFIENKRTTTRPLPGPVIVSFDPPKIEQIIPPTIEAITPEIGGASEAIANPRARGSATKETTNPEKIFLGRSPKNSFKLYELDISIRFNYKNVCRKFR